MPALRLLGRRWMFASDDLVFPALGEIPYRIIWLVLIILVMQDSGPFPGEKADSAYARFFVGATMGLQVFMLILLLIIAQQSARGSLMEVEKRANVGPLLLCKLFTLILEIGLNVMGMSWVFFDVITCQISPFAKAILRCMTIISWIHPILIAMAMYSAYDPLGTTEYADLQTEEQRETYHKKFTKIMASRIEWVFWFFNDSNMKEAVMEMASLLSILFRATDLVLYDLIAGSILLRVRQKQETRIQRATAADPTDALYTTDLRKISGAAPSWMTISEAQHYLRYATAAYGGLYVVYRYYCAGLCFIMPYLRCFCCRPQHVTGDNCCMCNYAGLKYMSEIADKDFIHVSFENHIFDVPFYVIAEHQRKRIVVTVRGSISIHDMFTDLAGAAVNFRADGLPEGTQAHKGMVLGTENTYERLLPILERAFEDHPDYELVITGHSLGAAVSTLLGIKLKSRYSHLKVFAFSTPSGLLSREAAKYTENFVMTVGVGDDLVMRISVQAAQMFRDRLIETMEMTRLPKYRILLKGLRYAFFKIPESDLNSIWKSTDDIEAELVGSSRVVRSPLYDGERLFVGGRILHIVPHVAKENDRNIIARDIKFKLRWASPEDFTELVVTPGMLRDHMPENLAEPIKHILEKCSSSTY